MLKRARSKLLVAESITKLAKWRKEWRIVWVWLLLNQEKKTLRGVFAVFVRCYWTMINCCIFVCH